jgi:hypothetical protein
MPELRRKPLEIEGERLSAFEIYVFFLEFQVLPCYIAVRRLTP